jgi:hypothetical protein
MFHASAMPTLPAALMPFLLSVCAFISHFIRRHAAAIDTPFLLSSIDYFHFFFISRFDIFLFD